MIFLYRKMSLDEYNTLLTEGLTFTQSSAISLCPKKCLSESLISAYRLNPRFNALSQVIAQLSFSTEFRQELLESGLSLNQDMHADKFYGIYAKYAGCNLYYRCHGSLIDLFTHEIDIANIKKVNERILNVKLVNSEDYRDTLLQNFLNVSNFEEILTERSLEEDEYYIQLPVDLAILALKYNIIPPGGLNKHIKTRNIGKDYEALDEENKGIFPVTLGIKIKSDLPYRIKKEQLSKGLFAVASDNLFHFSKLINGIRLIEYIDERARYKYASEILNNKISILDIIRNNINTDGLFFGEGQINIDQTLNIISQSPILDYFINIISNINEHIYIDSDYHGKTHAERVAFFSFIIASYMNLTEEDIKILIYASLLHDIGRISEYDDQNHGSLGAKKIEDLALFINDENTRKKIQFLIESHDIDINEANIASLIKKYNIENNSTIIMLLKILKDADALDRARFTVFNNSSSKLNKEFLNFSVSKALIAFSEFVSKVYYNNSTLILKRG